MLFDFLNCILCQHSLLFRNVWRDMNFKTQYHVASEQIYFFSFSLRSGCTRLTNI